MTNIKEIKDCKGFYYTVDFEEICSPEKWEEFLKQWKETGMLFFKGNSKGKIGVVKENKIDNDKFTQQNKK